MINLQTLNKNIQFAKPHKGKERRLASCSTDILDRETAKQGSIGRKAPVEWDWNPAWPRSPTLQESKVIAFTIHWRTFSDGFVSPMALVLSTCACQMWTGHCICSCCSSTVPVWRKLEGSQVHQQAHTNYLRNKDLAFKVTTKFTGMKPIQDGCTDSAWLSLTCTAVPKLHRPVVKVGGQVDAPFPEKSHSHLNILWTSSQTYRETKGECEVFVGHGLKSKPQTFCVLKVDWDVKIRVLQADGSKPIASVHHA